RVQTLAQSERTGITPGNCDRQPGTMHLQRRPNGESWYRGRMNASATEEQRGMDLSRDELARYARQINLAQVGEEGQRRLKKARVLCIGAGGLGSPAALYLSAAGIGTIGIVDQYTVDPSNLHRQLLHGTADVGREKTDSARSRLLAINPTIEIETYTTRLSAGNATD